MATSEDGGDGACFMSPTMQEFKLLEQSADAALGTFSGSRGLRQHRRKRGQAYAGCAHRVISRIPARGGEMDRVP
jgi:hypothetical protein